MRTIVALVLSAGLAASCTSPVIETAAGHEQDKDPGLIEAGREVAMQECAGCHAIDRETASPLAGAPPLMTILSQYDPDMLANDLIEGVRLGHDKMPAFDFNIIAADALVAYLRSIESPSR